MVHLDVISQPTPKVSHLTLLLLGLEDRRRNGVIQDKTVVTVIVRSHRSIVMDITYVITTSGAFKSLWSEQDGDLTFLHKIQ